PSGRSRPMARPSVTSATSTRTRRRSLPPASPPHARISFSRSGAATPSRPTSREPPSTRPPSSSPPAGRAASPTVFHPQSCAPTRRARSPCRCNRSHATVATIRGVPRNANGLSTALLLHGDERFLVDERSRATLDEWRQGLVSDFGFETLEGAGLTSARLNDAILQAPFLDPHRVVFARMVPANRSEGLAP